MKSDQQIQCNPHQNSNIFFIEIEENNLQIHMEEQMSLRSESNPEQREKWGRYHNT
jgi:hypothetical protein